MRKTAVSNALLVILIAMVMVLPTLPGAHQRITNFGTIDGALLHRMNALDPDAEVEVIVQFHDELLEQDIRELERLDIEVLMEYQVLPAVYARASVKDILSLSGYGRTYWIEYNQENELLLQETTTHIGVNNVWTLEVLDGEYVEFDFNPQSQLTGLDGSGVTIAIVDTGVDGEHPDLDYGEKLIMNKHKNGPEDPWVEMENSDTSYGHGTHCAGISAGNGDASGGMRRGVAPGANLIGVGGDWTPVYWAVLDGLEWVYENSRPGNNPHNIRVVSNSWGGDGNYDPQDAITVITTKLMFDNNVVCVFAAGNSGGENHDGASDSTGQQSKIPAVVSVAATTHDARGMAGFSSRGKAGDHITYPDVAAPGVDIWATRPRYTWLGEYQLVDEDMYYMAISGTSMATPHVSGLVAVLFQAAPSMRVSEYHEDDNAPEGSWGDDHNPFIHEAEYILKMTSDMIPATGENGVPQANETGHRGRDLDFAQGYGLVNSERAIAIALALEKLRKDHPEATVDDALEQLEGIMRTASISEDTDTLVTSWRGEWAQLTNGSNPLSDTSFSTDQHHRIFIPEEATFLQFDLNYNPLDVNSGTGGRVDVTLDWDGDNNNDLMPQGSDVDGTKHYELDLTEEQFREHKGNYWTFNVEGDGIKVPISGMDDEFHEATIEYTIGLSLTFGPGAEITFDETDYLVDASPWRFGHPSTGYDDSTITLQKNVFRISDVQKEDSFFEEHGSSIAIGLIVFLAGLICGIVLLLHRFNKGEVVEWEDWPGQEEQ